MKKIVITGGHLTPAMAVIEELKNRGWGIYYFGRKFSFEGQKVPSEESKIIPKLKVKFIPISAGRLQRKFTFHTIPSLLKVPLGFFQALLLISKIKPQIILSFGSYVSTPTVLAGWLFNIPVLSHEQTVSLGLANKINSFFSRKIAVSFKNSLKNFPVEKVVFTGNCLRKDIFISRQNSFTREVALKKRKLGLPIIYITGGNQGARVINLSVAEILPELLKKFIIIHQTGSLDYGMISEISQSLPESVKERYFIKNYVSSEEIGWIFKNALMVVSRAGANITYELGALGKPAILIPLPISGGGEQLKNARMLFGIGLAEIIEQKNLTPKNLKKSIDEITGKISLYQKNGQKIKKNFPRNGTKEIVKLVYEVLSKKEKK